MASVSCVSIFLLYHIFLRFAIVRYCLKAKAAAEKYPDCTVIGCDTTVICGGEILGKPKDKSQCIADISKLSGRTHQVVTGCCIICGGKVNSFSEVTDVTFRQLTASEIEAYADTDEPYDLSLIHISEPTRL